MPNYVQTSQYIPQLRETIKFHNVLHCVQFAGTYNRNIQVYDAQTQMLSQSLSGHFGSVTSLIISRSGRFLFSASSDATIKVSEFQRLT